MHIPDFSAMGLILLMYARGSRNSSGVGSKTGASGGTVNVKLSGFMGDAESPILTSTLASSHFPIFEKKTYVVLTKLTIINTLTSSNVKE